MPSAPTARNAPAPPMAIARSEALDPVRKAAHLFVMHRAEHLLVTEGGRTVGVLRLVDVFAEVLSAIRACPAE